jgi:hypothetical protein
MLFRRASARGAFPARALLIESLRLKLCSGLVLNRRQPEGSRRSCPLQCLFALYPLRTLLLLLTLQLSRYCCLPARSPGSLARIAAVFRGTHLDYYGTRSVSRGNFPVAASRGYLTIVSEWRPSYRPSTAAQRSPNDPPCDEVLASQEGRPGVPASSGRGRLDTVPSWKPTESRALCASRTQETGSARRSRYCLCAVHTLQRTASRRRHSCTHLSVEGACEREHRACAPCIRSRGQR